MSTKEEKGPDAGTRAAAPEIVAALALVVRRSSEMVEASRLWVDAIGGLREALDRHGWGFAFGALVADASGNPLSPGDGEGGWTEEAERRLRAMHFDTSAGRSGR